MKLRFASSGPDFGECIVVHFGNNRWFVVDSCQYPGISDPVALHYLQQLRLAARGSRTNRNNSLAQRSLQGRLVARSRVLPMLRSGLRQR